MNDCLVVYIEINIALRIDNEEIVGSQIVAHTQMETGDGLNKPNTINL